MKDEMEFIRAFLSNVGVAAEVQLGENDQPVIIIATGEYQRRRAWIEAWFTLISQNEQFSYFRERLRGTGQTE